MTQVIVWKVLGWYEIKRGVYAGQGMYQRIALKRLDTNKTVYLNLPEHNIYPGRNKWAPYLYDGNVLGVTLQPGGKNVNYFEPFQVIEVKAQNKEYLREQAKTI